MRERLVKFGEEGHLVGTLLEVAASSLNPLSGEPPVAVLAFNAGLIPRMGPHRLWVKLARRLEKDGHSSFRFDLNGQGDSTQANSTLAFESQAVQDIVAAMDTVMAQTGIRRFVLAGICSGAALSYKAALADARVVACVMIDVYMYPTWRTRWVSLRHRMIREGGVKILKEVTLQRLKALRRYAFGLAPVVQVPNALPGLEKPTPQEFALGLQSLLTRRTKLLMIYTGSFLFHYNYQNQFLDRFKPFRLTGPMRVDFDPNLDHTVTEVRAQQFVLDKLCRWISEI
jgi:pimeloyl-ACP methyl ester carboxylesterase